MNAWLRRALLFVGLPVAFYFFVGAIKDAADRAAAGSLPRPAQNDLFGTGLSARGASPRAPGGSAAESARWAELSRRERERERSAEAAPALSPEREQPRFVVEDPFRPLPGSAAAPFRLRATIEAAGRRLALVDERIVAVGDRIGEYTVVGIEPRTVLLDRFGTSVRLSLEKGPQ